MVSTLDIFSRQHIGDNLFFSNKNLTFGDNLHDMSNSGFQEKNTKMFKLSAETKFNIQHFEIFFLFFPENKNLLFFFWDNINLSSPAELAQRVKKVKATVILKYTCEIYK